MERELRYKNLQVKVKSADPAKRQIRAIFSTGTEDRHGEIVDQKGWDLTNFMNNPVVLWSHDMTTPAIGNVVDLSILDGNLEGTIQFAGDYYPLAELIFNLFNEGILHAISVGFMNTKWQYDEPNDQFILLENELYEVSVVNVPANALALAKSKGINTEAIEKRMEKTEKVNEKILKKEAPAETKPGEEKKEEPQEVPPTPETDAQKGKMQATEAIEVLLASDNDVIKAAVKELQVRLGAADIASQSDRSKTDGKKKYRIADINRVIRSLHKGKAAK